MSVATASALTIEDSHHQRQILNNFDVKHCEKFAAHHTAEINKSDNRTMHLHQLSSDDITTTTNTTTINSKQIAGGGAPPSSPPASQLHHLQHQPTAIDSPSFNQHYRLLEEEIESLKAERTRLTQQCSDAQRREKILMRRLANKEQEFQDYVSQIAEYKSAQAPGASAIRSSLLDPAVNLLFEKLKKELQATKAKLEETQNELAAWKFTPDSNTGKRLMAKCRLLYQENEELGKMTSNGRLAKLETELAMQKSFSEEVKKSQSELDDFLQELDEDVEGMQSTILFLQQELKTTRDRIQLLEKENYHLKNENLDDDDSQSVCVSHSIINGIKVSTDSETKIIADAALNVANNSSVSVHSLDNTTQHALLLNDEQTKSNKFHTNHSNYQSSIVVVAEVLESIDDKSNLRTTTANCVPGRTIGEKGDLSDLVNGGCGKNRNDTTGIIAIGGGGGNIDESNNSSSVDNGGNGGGSNNKLRLNTNSRKRHYESDSDSDSGSASITLKNSRSLGGLNATKKGKKKLAIRRSSSIIDTTKDMGDVSGSCSVNDEVGGGEVAEELDVATEQKSDHDADDDGITSGLSALTSGTNMLTAAITGAGNTRVLGRKKSLRNHQNGGENNL